MIPLNERLKKVATYINHDKLADIGSDHAYLPLYLLENLKIKYAVAGEVVDGPFQAAVKNVKKYGHEKNISVRKGNGLEVIEVGEVDVITICGMGGPLIKTILLEGMDKLSHFPDLVLQSNIHTQAVREAIIELGYTITDEHIMEDKGHVYEIVAARKAEDVAYYTKEQMKFGPMLLEHKNETFIQKWSRELNQLEKIYTTIKDESMHQQRAEEIKQEITMLKEVLA